MQSYNIVFYYMSAKCTVNDHTTLTWRNILHNGSSKEKKSTISYNCSCILHLDLFKMHLGACKVILYTFYESIIYSR